MNSLKFDCLIIGAGPSGITGGIYLQNAKINVAIVEKSAPSSKIATLNEINNYLGEKSIKGIDLAMKFQEQLFSANIPYFSDEVIDIKEHQEHFEVVTNTTSYLSKYVLISTGIINKKLGILNEDKFFGQGISYCSVCDGALYKDKVIALAGKTINNELKYLQPIAKTIHVFGKKQKNHDNVIFHEEEITEFLGKFFLQQIKTSKEIIDVDGCFINNGVIPGTSFLKNLNEKYPGLLSDKGFINVDSNYETNIKKIYAVGDAINYPVKQISFASGTACAASHNIISSIKKETK